MDERGSLRDVAMEGRGSLRDAADAVGSAMRNVEDWLWVELADLRAT